MLYHPYTFHVKNRNGAVRGCFGDFRENARLEIAHGCILGRFLKSKELEPLAVMERKHECWRLAEVLLSEAMKKEEMVLTYGLQKYIIILDWR